MKLTEIVAYMMLLTSAVSSTAEVVRKPEEGNKYAVILTTESYANKPASKEFDGGLKNAFLINTANQYDDLIKLGYKPENIKVLFADGKVDYSEPKDLEKIANLQNVEKASKSGFYNALDDLSTIVNDKDELTVIIQGHGKKTGNSSYMQIGDERITPQELEQYAGRIKGGKETYVVDACYSGNFSNLAKDEQEVFTSSTKDSPGIISREDSFSRSLFNSYNNSRADANNDGKISSREAFNFAEEQRLSYLQKHEEAGHTYKHLYDLDGFKGQAYNLRD